MSNYEAKEIKQEWWVVGGGGKFGPFSKAMAEEYASLLNDKGIVTDKSHSGRIHRNEGGLLKQSTGRHAEFVVHDASKLSEPVKENEVVDISYKNGIGFVGRSKGIER
jgi:hypothetical protein